MLFRQKLDKILCSNKINFNKTQSNIELIRICFNNIHKIIANSDILILEKPLLLRQNAIYVL